MSRVEIGYYTVLITWQIFMFAVNNFNNFFALFSEYFLNVPLAIEIREPIQIVRNQMIVLTAFTGNNYHSPIVGNL